MKNVTSEFVQDPEEDFQVQAANLELAERVQRLKTAVRRGGGNKAVSERSGIPLSNIGAYVAGREMKVPALVSLSKACGVNLLWLATGEGPMSSDAQVLSTPTNPSSDRQQKTFSTIKIDLMAQALEAARKTFSDAGASPEPRELVQVMLLLYDGMNKP
jgi:hypothetical protein